MPGTHEGDGEPERYLRWGTSEPWTSDLRRRVDTLALSLITRLAETPPAALESALLEALEAIGSMLDFDQATLLEYEAERDGSLMRSRSTWIKPGASIPSLTRIQGACPDLMARVLGGEPVGMQRLDDTRSQAPYDSPSLRALGIRSLLLLPLVLGGTIDGALALVSMRRTPYWTTLLPGEIRTLCHVVTMGLHLHESRRVPPARRIAGAERGCEPTGLTDRQLEVLRLLGRGQTMKQIAERLDISPRTVAFHKTRIKEAMGAANTADLVRRAIAANALDP